MSATLEIESKAANLTILLHVAFEGGPVVAVSTALGKCQSYSSVEAADKDTGQSSYQDSKL